MEQKYECRIRYDKNIDGKTKKDRLILKAKKYI